MEYPIRSETHEIESASWTLLLGKTPSNWIVRQVSERDYGIDFYVEIANKERQITGEMFSGQLKGTQHIQWNADGTATLSGIEQSTINYWMGLPMPVFLFVANLEAAEVYVCPVEHHVRRHYGAFLQQKTLGFTLHRRDLATPEGQMWFIVSYFREKSFEHFRNYVRDLIMRWQEYWDFIQANQMRDCFLGVEEEQQLQFIQLYRSLHFLTDMFGIEWTVEDLGAALTRDREEWKDPYYELHEATLDRLLKQIEPLYISTLEKAIAFVTEDENDYWRICESLLWRLTTNLHDVGASLRSEIH